MCVFVFFFVAIKIKETMIQGVNQFFCSHKCADGGQWWVRQYLNPWMPSRIHSTQSVRIVCDLYECIHAICFATVKSCDSLQSIHYCVHGGIHQHNDIFHIELGRFGNDCAISVQLWFFILQSLLVDGNNFIAEYCSQYGGYLIIVDMCGEI